jgi:hypothetical protein
VRDPSDGCDCATLDSSWTPGLRRPGEVGLDFEDMTFPSMDGVALEGWFKVRQALVRDALSARPQT